MMVLGVAQPVVIFAELPGSFIPRPSATRTPSAAPSPIPFSRGLKVAIQIGHYKIKEVPPELSSISKQWGTYGGGRNEVDVAMDIGTRLKPLLEAQGLNVELLPTTVPGNYTADAFLSLHADGAGDKTRRGFKVTTRYNSPIPPQDAMLTEMLTEAYSAATGLPQDYRVNSNMREYYAFAPHRTTYRISNYTPAAIIEMGYMTNAEDRALLFSGDKIASGLAVGMVRFLKAAYPKPGSARGYGAGITDKIIGAAPIPTPDPEDWTKAEEGDWQLFLMGNPLIKIYRESGGGGGVAAELPRGRFHPSTLRKGNFYRITLPNGDPGWVYINAVIVKRDA